MSFKEYNCVGTIAIDGTKLKANASYRKTKKASDLDEDIAIIGEQIESILISEQEQQVHFLKAGRLRFLFPEKFNCLFDLF